MGWLDDRSRMSGDVHVRFCEGVGVKLPALLDVSSLSEASGREIE